MPYLLDTHTFIWFINGDQSLSDTVVEIIKDTKNQCFISIASIWEIAIKVKLNKLEISCDFDRILNFIEENQIEVLPISFNHLLRLNHLEFHHRDPFDRLLLAQSFTEKLTILSKDRNFSLYNANVVW
ncbi:MAG: type II toxin-antitoxin system VapC family toxin [Pedobacter sp.]